MIVNITRINKVSMEPNAMAQTQKGIGLDVRGEDTATFSSRIRTSSVPASGGGAMDADGRESGIGR